MSIAGELIPRPGVSGAQHVDLAVPWSHTHAMGVGCGVAAPRSRGVRVRGRWVL